MTRLAMAWFWSRASARFACSSAASSSPRPSSDSARAARASTSVPSISRARRRWGAGLGVELLAVVGEPERDEGEGAVRLELARLLEGHGPARHVAGLHERDAEQVLVLHDRGHHPRQGLEGPGRDHRGPGGQRHARLGAQDLLGVRGQLPRPLQDVEGPPRVADAGLDPREAQQRLHRPVLLGQLPVELRRLHDPPLGELRPRPLQARLELELPLSRGPCRPVARPGRQRRRPRPGPVRPGRRRSRRPGRVS